MKNSNIKNKALPYLLHALVWLVLIILPQIIISRLSGNNDSIAWRFYINASIIGIIFYVNYLWLVPKFYLNEKKALFFILTLLLVVCCYFLLDYTNQILHNQDRNRVVAESIEKGIREKRSERPPFKIMQIYGYSLLSVVIIGFSFGLRIIEKHAVSEKKQKELEKEKLNSELAFLKNQVSPHFFFNTLNNIYSLIEINTTDAQESVLKLSKLMRYLLYESEHGETQLSNELDFMKHYIDLMKLRISKKVKLEIEFPEKYTDFKIPPLLFIPFIENAFKHGISYRDKSFINISMQTNNNTIVFNCSNSLAMQTDKETSENHSGIGLENVKKRLNLLFPNRHSLKIEKKEQTFDVQLEINLS